MNRYADYVEMDQYGEPLLGHARFRRAPTEPSAIDRLAAVADAEAARRVRAWEEHVERMRENLEIVRRLTKAPARFSFKIDVGRV